MMIPLEEFSQSSLIRGNDRVGNQLTGFTMDRVVRLG